MDGDDLTDEQRAGLMALFDAIEHGAGAGDLAHADAVAAGLDGPDDEADEATDLDDATDLHDDSADY